jgi:hypothetical protein
MALDLENKIMREIGLGSDPSWHAGGSCLETRCKAAKQLGSVIRRHAINGAEIALPDRALIAAVARVAGEGEESNYVLRATHGACLEAIRAHMVAYHETGAAARRKTFQQYTQAVLARIPTGWRGGGPDEHGRIYFKR